MGSLEVTKNRVSEKKIFVHCGIEGKLSCVFAYLDVASTLLGL